MARSDETEPALQRLEFVSQGAHGRVDLVVLERTGHKAALKTLFRDHGACEAHILLTLNSPFVPRLIQHWINPRGKGCILMEDCGTTLDDVLIINAHCNTKFQDPDIRWVLWSVASALDCAHNHGWAHNDVKTLNVCCQPVVDSKAAEIYRRAGVEPQRVRLVDWGAATALDWHDNRTRGTSGYNAPENTDLTQGCTSAHDTWMLGCLLLKIVTHGTFDCNHPSEVLETWLPNAITDCQQKGQLTLANLLQKLLEERPELRLGAGQGLVTELLEHPYFSGLSPTQWVLECALRTQLCDSICSKIRVPDTPNANTGTAKAKPVSL